MDSEPDTLRDAGSTPVVRVKSDAQDYVEELSNSTSMMDYVAAVRMVVEQLYLSEDIKVRLCWWLIYCVIALCILIIFAWKVYGHEIMTVLACQDRFTRSGSLSSGSSRQSSSEETLAVAEPLQTPQEQWKSQLPSCHIDSSISETQQHHHHHKAD